MNISIQINGQLFELTDKQIQDIEHILQSGSVALADIAEGETFKIGEYEFIVLEQSGDTTAVILKDLLHESEKFGGNNNFDGSGVDKLCRDFATEIAAKIGALNLVEHTVDLTSDDGLKDYGSVKRHMSLLTAQQYRKYVPILDKHKLKKWWWLVTAYSTPSHEDNNWVKCVSPLGDARGNYCYGNRGVRPFCILKSNIFVSK